jgi:hypothetical protein
MAMKKLSKSTLRWYIGTKSLMPIVEIRRRFGINGDEVTVLRDEQGNLYVGLPEQAAHALEDLRQNGKIGYELAVDFNARVLIGAYVMYGRKNRNGEAHAEEPEPDEGAEDAA